MVGSDLNAIRHALALARKRGFDEVEVTVDGLAFRARLSTTPGPVREPADDSAAQTAETPQGGLDVLSPVVGYLRAKGKPLVVGRKVQKGEILAVVSGLGLESDVESPGEGEIVEVSALPDQAVEFAQQIARIEVTA